MNFKKMLPLLLALAMVISLFGACGSTQSSVAEDAVSTAEDTAQASEEAPPADAPSEEEPTKTIGGEIRLFPASF